MAVGVSEIPSFMNDVPKYLVLASLNDVSVALFRASTQLCAVSPHRLQYFFVQHQLIVYRQKISSSYEPIHFYLNPSFSRFFLTFAFKRS
jgi:hypothetical protein